MGLYSQTKFYANLVMISITFKMFFFSERTNEKNFSCVVLTSEKGSHHKALQWPPNVADEVDTKC